MIILNNELKFIYIILCKDNFFLIFDYGFIYLFYVNMSFFLIFDHGESTTFGFKKY
jgi:hypothetical protein